MRSLYKICASRILLPTSLQIELCDNPTGFALYRGGFRDVWKQEYEGLEVAVKVLRTYVNSDLRKITRVSHRDDQPRDIRPSADHNPTGVLQGVRNMEDSSPSERVTAPGSDND